MQDRLASDEFTSSGARRLQVVVDRVETFLAAQLDRLERVLEQCEHGAAEQETADRLRRELQEQRRQWEQERLEEMGKIKQAGAQLTEAWDRLEAEQRRLLAERESLRSAPGGGHAQAAGPADGTAMPTESPGATARGNPPPNGPGRSEGTAQDAVSPEAARLQFQQLKREVRRHARGNRQRK